MINDKDKNKNTTQFLQLKSFCTYIYVHTGLTKK